MKIQNFLIVLLLSIFFFAHQAYADLVSIFPVFPAPADETHIYLVEPWPERDVASIMRFDDLAKEITHDGELFFDDREEIASTHGASVDPTTGIVYIAVRFSYGGNAQLATVDMATGRLALVGNLGDKFAAIAFGKDGLLYGLTGNGANAPSSLYTINKDSAVKTLLASYAGTSVSGEALAYNFDDQYLYRATGNSMFRIDPNNPTHPEVVYEGNDDIADNSSFSLLYKGDGIFYLWGYETLFEVGVSTGDVAVVMDSYENFTNKCAFYWNPSFGPKIKELIPQKGSNTFANNDNLQLIFNENIEIGSGNVTIKKYDNDEVVENIAITSEQITGWGNRDYKYKHNSGFIIQYPILYCN